MELLIAACIGVLVVLAYRRFVPGKDTFHFYRWEGSGPITLLYRFHDGSPVDEADGEPVAWVAEWSEADKEAVRQNLALYNSLFEKAGVPIRYLEYDLPGASVQVLFIRATTILRPTNGIKGVESLSGHCSPYVANMGTDEEAIRYCTVTLADLPIAPHEIAHCSGIAGHSGRLGNVLHPRHQGAPTVRDVALLLPLYTTTPEGL